MDLGQQQPTAATRSAGTGAAPSPSSYSSTSMTVDANANASPPPPPPPSPPSLAPGDIDMAVPPWIPSNTHTRHAEHDPSTNFAHSTPSSSSRRVTGPARPPATTATNTSATNTSASNTAASSSSTSTTSSLVHHHPQAHHQPHVESSTTSSQRASRAQDLRHRIASLDEQIRTQNNGVTLAHSTLKLAMDAASALPVNTPAWEAAMVRVERHQLGIERVAERVAERLASLNDSRERLWAELHELERAAERQAERRRMPAVFVSPYGAVDREMIDVTKVGSLNVPDLIVGPSDVLLTAFAWLLFKLTMGDTPLGPIKAAQTDEKVYYDILRGALRAAAAGCPGITIESRTTGDGPAPVEDIAILVDGQPVSFLECKASFAYAKSGGVGDVLAANETKFAQTFSYARNAHHNTTKNRFLHILADRCEYVLLAEFEYDRDNAVVTACRVTPGTPTNPPQPHAEPSLLCPLKDLDEPHVTKLAHVLPDKPTPGFDLLVRFMRRLLVEHVQGQRQRNPITLRVTDPASLAADNVVRRVLRDGDKLNIASASILASGRHSLVLSVCPDGQTPLPFVIKVSRTLHIDREIGIHARVDGAHECIRKMLCHGVVEGAGADLSFIVLDGMGEPFWDMSPDTSQVQRVRSKLEQYWKDACGAVQAMHDKRVLHCDLKPSNLVYINDRVVVNDFDCSVLLEGDNEARSQLQAGTPLYRSPFVEKRWEKHDDWLSLGLTFLVLAIDGVRPTIDKEEKKAILRRAAHSAAVPDFIRTMIRHALWLAESTSSSAAVSRSSAATTPLSEPISAPFRPVPHPAGSFAALAHSDALPAPLRTARSASPRAPSSGAPGLTSAAAEAAPQSSDRIRPDLPNSKRVRSTGSSGSASPPSR